MYFHEISLFDYFFENLSRKFKFDINPTRIMGIVHEDVCTFMITSGRIILIMRHVLDKSFRKN
jgi:hypothetical protein